jgi:tetratricopeptide (TPR) repeat protein
MNTTATATASLSSITARRPLLTAGLLLAALGVAVYANSLSNPFVFDDLASISNNEDLRHFDLLTHLWSHPRAIGLASFALNYAWGGLDVRGYHAVNVAIHVSAALALFGIVRRTLLSPLMRDRFGADATGLALVVAAIWLVHPLQTESVTYLVQRFQSLMGLFYLLTLYCFIRGYAGNAKAWRAASIVCFALAMRTKEDAITAPLVVLWYDRVFFCQSFRQLLDRKFYYGAMLLVILLTSGNLLLHVASNLWPQLVSAPPPPVAEPKEEEEFLSVLHVRGVTPLTYLATQPTVILLYLRLCFWPTDLCLDYRWPVAESVGEWLPGAIVVAALLALIAFLARRRPELGFIGGAFFLILAPTSSILPIQDLAVEHRMYLPLAAVVAAAVLSVYAWRGSRLRSPTRSASSQLNVRLVLASLAIGILGMLTILRNQDYASNVTIWEDVVAKRPLNARGYAGLGLAHVGQNDFDDAVRCYQTALELDPAWVEAYYNLANLLARHGRPAEAIPYFREAVSLNPRDPRTQNNLAAALFRVGRIEEAAEHYQASLGYRKNPAVFQNLAKCLELLNKPGEAIEIYRQALEIEPRGTRRFADLTASMQRLQTSRNAANN